MGVIYRYEVGLRLPDVLMPVGAEVISAAPARSGRAAYDVWAIVDPDAPQETRRFHVVATGAVAPTGARFLATMPYEGGRYILHLFEVPPATVR